MSKVSIHIVEEKMAAIYIYGISLGDISLAFFLNVYEEEEKTKKNFEVVFIYLEDGPFDEQYRKVFKTMPWLALPF